LTGEVIQVALIVVLPSVAVTTIEPMEETEAVKLTVRLREPAGMTTMSGIARRDVPDLRMTVVFEVAFAVRLTVQKPLDGRVVTVNAQASAASVGVALGAGGTKEIEAVAVAVPRVAVKCAVWDVVNVLEVTPNVPVVALAATVSEAGIVRTDAASLESDSVVAADGVPDRVTVQVAEEFELKLEWSHCNEGVMAVATSEIVALALEPFKEAVTVPVWLVVKLPADAEKVAVMAPAATLTVAGTVSALAPVAEIVTEVTA
jgi:hypothetical protein